MILAMKYDILIALFLGTLATTFSQGNVGINTDSPVASLHVHGNTIFDSNLVVGATHTTDYPARLLFYNDEHGAFRFGTMDDNQWNSDNLGENSFAGGKNTNATGSYAFAMGYTASATGDLSTAFGSLTEATGLGATAVGAYARTVGESALALGPGTYAVGLRSVAMGYYSSALGVRSIAIGGHCYANGSYAATIGTGLIANGYSSVVVGIYNDSLVAPQGSLTGSTPLFIVGNGSNYLVPSNAMVVYQSGKVEIDGQLQVGTGTQINQIQSGTDPIGTNPVGGVKATSITFPEGAFSTTPHVICTVRGGNFVDTFVVSTRSVSTTGFTVNVFRVDNGGGNWGQSLELDWIAVN